MAQHRVTVYRRRWKRVREPAFWDDHWSWYCQHCAVGAHAARTWREAFNPALLHALTWSDERRPRRADVTPRLRIKGARAAYVVVDELASHIDGAET